MGWIIAIIVGGVAGWLASLVMNRDASMGIFWNIIVGIVGAHRLVFQEARNRADQHAGRRAMGADRVPERVGLELRQQHHRPAID